MKHENRLIVIVALSALLFALSSLLVAVTLLTPVTVLIESETVSLPPNPEALSLWLHPSGLLDLCAHSDCTLYSNGVGNIIVNDSVAIVFCLPSHTCGNEMRNMQTGGY